MLTQMIKIQDNVFNNFDTTEYEDYFENLKSITDNTFDDDKWFISKQYSKQMRSKGSLTLYFKIPDCETKLLTKYYSVFKLTEKGVTSIKGDIYGMEVFYKFYTITLSKSQIHLLKNEDIDSFTEFLFFSQDFEPRTKETIFSGLKNFVNFFIENSVCSLNRIKKNPFTVKKEDRKSEKKYLPKELLDRLDVYFKDESIPLEFRLTYFIGRIVPSRITEICSIPLDCVICNNSEYTLLIPSFKTARRPDKPRWKKLVFKNEDMGALLLKLINQQKEISKEVQANIVDPEEKGFLISYPMLLYNPIKGYMRNNNKIVTMKEPLFNGFMRKLFDEKIIIDDQGNSIAYQTGIGRHVGITNRTYAGFRLIDIESMTLHESTQSTIDGYFHNIPEKQRTKNLDITTNPNIDFKGRITSGNEKNILRRPYSNRLYKIGLCSDNSKCKSQMYDCISCEHFLPDNEAIPYFKECLESYKHKLELYSNQSYLADNIKYNIRLYKRLIAKISATKH